MTTHGDVLVNLLKKRTHSVGCEVGTHTGDTTAKLLKKLPDIEIYHAIDPWETYTKYDGTEYRKPGNKLYKSWKKAINHFLDVTHPYKNKVVIYRMTSVEAVSKFQDNILDWIFIDANHDYPYIKENLEIWFPKVKEGGIFSGHDYGNKWIGIKKAVDECIPKEKLNIEDHYVWWCIK